MRGLPTEGEADASGPDTSHVPCKFFRSGQCQAGKACPFSHSTDMSSADTPCKYFAKVCTNAAEISYPTSYPPS